MWFYLVAFHVVEISIQWIRRVIEINKRTNLSVGKSNSILKIILSPFYSTSTLVKLWKFLLTIEWWKHDSTHEFDISDEACSWINEIKLFVKRSNLMDGIKIHFNIIPLKLYINISCFYLSASKYFFTIIIFFRLCSRYKKNLERYLKKYTRHFIW